MTVDVRVTELEKDYKIEPISEAAKLVCRKHRGVVMKSYRVPKFSLDSVQEMYANYGAICFEFTN